jgi:hypothetical protein
MTDGGQRSSARRSRSGGESGDRASADGTPGKLRAYGSGEGVDDADGGWVAAGVADAVLLPVA